VSAFSGIDIPIDAEEEGGGSNDGTSGKRIGGNVTGGSNEVLLPTSVRTTLKGQAFMRVDRIKSMLDAVMEVAVQKTPEMRDMLRLYIDNTVSRTVLVKPIQAELNLARRRMMTVLSSCVDPGQAQRDLTQQLDSVLG
jgi:hypothetical protein